MLLESGSVYSWGLNANGQLGIGTNVTQENLPVLVSGLSNVVSVAGGGYHSLAITCKSFSSNDVFFFFGLFHIQSGWITVYLGV